MNTLDRRRFLSTLSAAAVASTVTPRVFAAEHTIQATLHIDETKIVAEVPTDFTGLSYESSQLAYPSFFSATNHKLIQMFRALSNSGVLRIGGNMSEFTAWSPADVPLVEDDQQSVSPAIGSKFVRTYTLMPKSIRNLKDFLEETNWNLIYGLNLAGGTVDNCLAEATFVHQTIGKRLIAFQLGNEPDLFRHNGNPHDTWSYEEFISHWKEFETALRSNLPDAPLAGPDTAFRPMWVGKFATDTKHSVKLLTAHYYAEGPPTDPRMTIDYLLNDPTNRFESHVGKAIELAKDAGLPYRLSEGNSCYNAGKAGVSDTLASALWAGDLLLQIAQRGGVGVNLHGGSYGYYTPIAGSIKDGFTARPIFYGMMLAREFNGASLLASNLDVRSTNVTAYAGRKGAQILIALFNKSDRPATIGLRSRILSGAGKSTVWRLAGPSIDAKNGITLAGGVVAGDGSWQPRDHEQLKRGKNGLQIELPAYSGASIALR